MAIFGALYDRVLGWAGHRHASWYLTGLSFSESTFFPIPPDVMLAPMVLAKPYKGWRYAAICTVASVVGGIVGYALGAWTFDVIEPLIAKYGYEEKFATAQSAFEQYGFWVILLAGFSPIPYKVFTIASGVVGMPFLPFVLGSAAGRAGRFFLVAGLIILGGEKMAGKLRQHVEILGWVAVVLVAGLVAFLQWR